MRQRRLVLAVVLLLMALLVACEASAPAAPAVEGVSYDDATETLTIELSDGSTLEADLDALVTSGELVDDLAALPEPAPSGAGASPTVTGAFYEASTQLLTLTMSNGAVVEADLRPLVTADELPGAAPTEPNVTVVDASYDPFTLQLSLTLSDGSAVRADLEQLATDTELAAVVLDNAELIASLIESRPTPTPAPPDVVVEDASYSPRTQTLTLTLSNGTSVRADMNALITTTELTAVVAALPATPTPVPVPSPSPTIAEPQDTLNVAMSEVGPAVFNNRDATYATLRFLMTTVGESMFQNNLDGQTAGRLVKDWSIESNPEGGVTYTFNLQPGVKWHDNLGDWGEFNADDFIYNVNLVTDDKSVHAIKAGMLRAYNCDECQLIKVDDLTVQLKRPTETFEVFWYTKQPAGSILSLESKAHVDAVGEEQAILDPVYSGSWEIIDYATGEFYEMRGVRDHWRKTPEWETLYWQGIAEESTRIANFLTEKIDTGKFLLEGIRELKENGNPDHKFIAFPDALTNRVQIFGMIHTGPDDLDGGQPGQPADTHVPDADGDIRARLDDGYFDCSHAFIPCDRDVNSDEWQKALKVRLALNYAIDRQKLVNNLSYGEGEAAYISNWGGHRLRFDQQGLNELVYSHDPAKAKQLMEEAGYTDGFKVDMVHPDLFPSGKPGAQAVCVMWLEAHQRTVQRAQRALQLLPTDYRGAQLPRLLQPRVGSADRASVAHAALL